MTASEFAFLALGLVLGVAAGAAFVEVARSRPPSRREVRVTVAPNSIRSRATTLAEESPSSDAPGPARGGPADRRGTDRDDESNDPPSGTPVGPGAAGTAQSGLPTGRPDGAPTADDPDAGPPSRTPVPFLLQPSGAWAGSSFTVAPAGAGAAGAELIVGSGRPPIAVAISREADPMMAAIRASSSTEAGAPANVDIDATITDRGGEASRAKAAGRATTITRAVEAPLATPNDGAQPARADAGGNGAETNGSLPASGSGSAAAGAAAADTGPCADLRRVADERCEVANLARDGARRAAETLRAAQREYDNHVGQAESRAATADPRAVRTAKETAQQAFRKARGAATSRDAIETAARDWLTEINRINLLTREAAAQADQHRAAAAVLAPALERLALEADAARISAESAEEACVAAREAVATCEEAAAVAAAAAAQPAAPPAIDESDDAEVEFEVPIAAASAATPPVAFDDDESMGSRAGEDAAVIRLLRGDREVLPRIVARLAGDDREEQRRWRTLLSELVEGLVARSIEAASFDFPAGHPFWGPFTRAQSRDIAAALASLGYRHDGLGDWADERVPAQRDLSLAVGYAGLDPMRIRQWPNEAEMHELLREVTVAADEYIWEAAGSLTLGELVSLLGRRADGLTDLWNHWGAVRPLLLAAG